MWPRMTTLAPPADDVALSRRRRAMSRGGYWGLGTMGIALVYGLLGSPPHRTAVILLALGGCLMSVSLGVAATRWPQLVRVRRPVMLLCTVAHIALTAALAIADGGADTPMALGFFGTITFTAYSLPSRLLPLFGSFNLGAYLLVYLVAGSRHAGFVPVELAGLLATGAACAHQHQLLVRQSRQLHEMARTDPLTGCLNRRGFDERLAAMLASDGPRPTLFVLDLDDFKAVNDRRGHLAGDDLLVRTTHAMRELLGEGVAIGRIGGDEFAAALTELPDGFDVPSVVATLEEHVSASVGTVTAPESGAEARALLEAADRDLYRHKARRKRRRGETLAPEIAPGLRLP
jgi:diguanylate cyclase (GGDEF)-like protein